MFSKVFSTPSKAYWVIQGAGLIWLLLTAGVLRSFGMGWTKSLLDATFFSMVFMGGVFVLDRIFSSFIPKGANTWLLLLLPVFLSWVGVMVHRYGLHWFWMGDEGYVLLLRESFILRWAMLAVVFVMVTLLAIVVSRLEQQEESQKRELHMIELSKEAELYQLRQQLQPHFLFNSLNSISALVVSQPQKAREMVLQLSDFLRGTIRKDLQAWIKLKEEMNYLRMYLEIEKVRFGHRLQVEFELEEGVNSMLLPQLLIQPLLENAIKHGLYGVTGAVKIVLKAYKEQHYLVLWVENPFDPESPASEGTGFGLSSVERRLYLLFGRMDLLKKDIHGDVFLVQVKIPQLK